MDKTVTLENLIAFAYNETEILDTINIVEAIDCDDEIAEEYEVILATKEVLDGSLMEPSLKALDKIFLYSKGKSRLQFAN
jgi:hypothetical protein